MVGLSVITALLGATEIPLPPYTFQDALLYRGFEMTRGLAPYRDIWYSGSPGILFLYALAIKIHHSYISVNILDILWRCATTNAIYLLTWRLYRRREGILAGILYAIISSALSANQGYNATPDGFVILPLSLGLYFYIDKRQRIGRNVLAGISFGIASLIRLQLCPIIAIFAISAALIPRHSWEPRPKRSKMFSFLYGVVIVYSMAIFYFLLSRALVDLYNEVIIYNLNEPLAMSGVTNWTILLYIVILPTVALIILIAHGIMSLDKVVKLNSPFKRRLLYIFTASISLIIVFSMLGMLLFFTKEDALHTIQYITGRTDISEYSLSFFHPPGKDEILTTFSEKPTPDSCVIREEYPYLNFLVKRIKTETILVIRRPEDPEIVDKIFYNYLSRRNRSLDAKTALYVSIADHKGNNCSCAVMKYIYGGLHNIYVNYCRQ